jgi:trans-aconitate methyltransferase
MASLTETSRVGVYDWLLDYEDIDPHLQTIFSQIDTTSPVCVFGCGTSTLSELLGRWVNRIVWSVDYDHAVIEHMRTRNASNSMLKWATIDLSAIPDDSDATTVIGTGSFCSVIDKVTSFFFFFY